MEESPSKSLDVLDFNAEDELCELAASKYTSKFKSHYSIDKYNFLENVAQGTNIGSKERGNAPCVDVDAINIEQNGASAFSHTSLYAREDCATKRMAVLNVVPQISSAIPEQLPRFRPNQVEHGSFFTGLEVSSFPGAASPGSSKLNCALLESPFTDESIEDVSDADERMSEKSPSTSSEFVEDDDGPLSNNCYSAWEMVDGDVAVVFRPDYIAYCDRHCTASVLTFSRSWIEMSGSTAYGNQGTFNYKWGIDDILDIESHWFGRLEKALVKIRVISKNVVKAEDVHGASGIEELKFAVEDSDWYEKQEAITSLDVRYKALWNALYDTDMERDGEALVGQNVLFLPKRYFPIFEESFEDVVYPKGDSDAVSISKRDVDLLEPDTFVNDTIIDFYIKYLKNQIPPDERHRFHFFNSFFFCKLADFDKDPSSAFQRVRKWTRKVNLFEKDYVFIPVNFNYHWSLIVICHAGEAAKFHDEDVEKSLKVPCILHMDSIKGSHTGLKGPVQSYLLEEWKEKQKEPSADTSSRFCNLRFIALELPQQQNSFDCGLFLLHYVELFLKEAPDNFNPFKITKFSNFLNVDWFQPAEASLKRVIIQRLMYDLLENHSREISPAAGSDKHCTSNCPKTNCDDETAVELLSERCSSSKVCHGNVPSSQTVQGIEITLLPESSLRSSYCVSDSAFVLREFFEAGAASGSYLDARYQDFDQTSPFDDFQSALSPIEEEVEAGGQYGYCPSTAAGLEQLAGIAPEACAFPYSSTDFRGETSWNPGISVHQAGREDIDSSPATSICASDDSLEVEVNENGQVGRDPNLKETIDHPRSPSADNIECVTECLALAPSEMLDADSRDAVEILNDNDSSDPLNSCPKNLLGLPPQDYDIQENGSVTCDDDSVSDSDIQHAAKKMRLTPPLDGEELTGSLSKDLHL